MLSAIPSLRNSSMLRALWMLPLGCQRVSGSVLKTVDLTPYMSRFRASASPIGPPPTMATDEPAATVTPYTGLELRCPCHEMLQTNVVGRVYASADSASRVTSLELH